MTELEKINNNITILRIKLFHIKIEVNSNYGFRTYCQIQNLFSDAYIIKQKIKSLTKQKIRIEKLNTILNGNNN